MLQIEYKTKKLERECTIADVSKKRYGQEMAIKIHMRIQEIESSDSVEDIIKHGFGRCHQLKGNYKGKYAMDLVNPYRLIFEKKGTEIQIVHIIDIKDYH